MIQVVAGDTNLFRYDGENFQQERPVLVVSTKPSTAHRTLLIAISRPVEQTSPFPSGPLSVWFISQLLSVLRLQS